ncbi:MAG: hypothetical protein WA192_09780 [Candidatus Acidiferrales bacterium]
MTDLDTTATITTSFNSALVSSADGLSDLAAGFPEFELNYTTAPTTTVSVNVAIALGTNSVTVTKAAQAGSAFTGIVVISRPATVTR